MDMKCFSSFPLLFKLDRSVNLLVCNTNININVEVKFYLWVS